MARVLVVDDEESIRETFSEFLAADGHEVSVAADVPEALRLFRRQEFDVVVSDIVMPRVSGLELLHEVRQTAPEVQVIIVTGSPTIETAAGALRGHAFDYLPKPVGGQTIRQAVANAANLRALKIEKRRLEAENENYRLHLENLVRERTAQLEAANASLHREIEERKTAQEKLERTLVWVRKNLDQTVASMSLTVEKRDPYTAGHQARVAQLAEAIGRVMRLTEASAEALRVAGLLHDIGKIAIPAEILAKPSALSQEEFALMRRHCETGAEILRTVEFPWPVAEIALQHHERWDGSGYPAGLRGEQTRLEARIIAVADVVEAMGHHRPYRPALGLDRALAHLSQEAGRLYDPAVVEATSRAFQEGGFEFRVG